MSSVLPFDLCAPWDSPAMTPCAAMNIISVRLLEKMTLCPLLRAERLVATLTLAFSYSSNALSYFLISYASLLKYFTAS